jgi:hypothetical protein
LRALALLKGLEEGFSKNGYDRTLALVDIRVKAPGFPPWRIWWKIDLDQKTIRRNVIAEGWNDKKVDHGEKKRKKSRSI